MKPIENQRMLDLLRVCRSELFVEHKLIDEGEYLWREVLLSREAHARLADYDSLRARLAAAEERAAKAEQLVIDQREVLLSMKAGRERAEAACARLCEAVNGIHAYVREILPLHLTRAEFREAFDRVAEVEASHG